ncbi:zinc metalloprotease HtpX [Campylobacter corcagiensis]|uniref:Protease HtpX homolog n=1 Tax=Campylobacter corcagiensis TaxID=1448857 RepID=A0A7M1LGG7_9BACT|nr:zinc metalloprotease HtpX [Campylobacter corcagiensis]QKF64116.1 heat shock protein HtpX, M48 family peptidase [Campylobacter corcagiensis]QOQ87689.1 zinc metalloprotease HtpX [Campylobacter corcagiensis]
MEIFKTTALMVGLMLLFVFVGGVLGGKTGMIIAFLLACGINFFSYFFSDKIVLKHYGAKPVGSDTRIYQVVEKLANKAGLPMPKVCIINENVPNAFATGRNPNNAVVAATTGLLDILNDEEIEGVLAHELSHVKHYDILTGSIASAFAGAISILGNFAQFGAVSNNNQNRNPILIIALAIIMPIVATIIQMSISRSREYGADKGAAMITKNPLALASALTKLENYARSGRVLSGAQPETSHMFIVNPFSGVKSNLANLFRTHPKTEDRIAALKQIDIELR